MVEKRPLSPLLMVVNYHPYTWNSSIIPCKKIMKKSKVQNRLGLIMKHLAGLSIYMISEPW